ncbi:MAG: CRTAC1 family protein [Phycisphaerales bacterium]|nr:CRTAC1 family protein [Phycisphaerales bacterium]
MGARLSVFGWLVSAAGAVAGTPSFVRVDLSDEFLDSAYHVGGTVTDFDNDGWPDIVFRGLFHNDGVGGFADVRGASGLPLNIEFATAGDVDGDGWEDVVNHGVLYRNEGDGSFSADPAWIDPALAGAGWGDYDKDGDLDLMLGGGYERDQAFCENTPAGFVNRIESILGQIQGSVVPVPFTQRCVDLNGDLLPDLLWVNDFHRTELWIQKSEGLFENVTSTAGLSITGTEMGADVADVDDDGDPDILIQDGAGCMLFLNDGQGQFQELGADAGIRQYGYGWGLTTLDLDQDGLLDFVGVGTSSRLLATNVWAWRQASTDDVIPTFEFVSDSIGLNGIGDGLFGVSDVDFDLDGDSDLVVYGAGAFRNDLSGDSHWLRVELDGLSNAKIPPAGIGSVVRARIGERWMTRWIDGGSNYRSQSERVAHFGLGASTIVDELRIEWTDGQITTLNDVVANQKLTIAAPSEACAFDTSGDNHVGLSDLAALLLVFGLDASDGGFDPRFDFVRDGAIDLRDLAALLANWDGECDRAPQAHRAAMLAVMGPVDPVRVGDPVQLQWMDSKQRARQVETLPEASHQGLIDFEGGLSADFFPGRGPMWFLTDEDVYSGTFALRSGVPQTGWSEARFRVQGPATLRFAYRLDAADLDRFRFAVDDEELVAVTGLTEWTDVSVDIPAGSRTVAWGYRKISSGSSTNRLNAAVIDDVRVETHAWTPLPGAQALTPAGFTADFEDGRIPTALATDSPGWAVTPFGQFGLTLRSPMLPPQYRAQLALATPSAGTLSFAYRVAGAGGDLSLQIGDRVYRLTEPESAFVEFPVYPGAVHAIWRIFNPGDDDGETVTFRIDNIAYTPDSSQPVEYGFPADVTSVEWTPTVAMPDCRVRIRARHQDGSWGPWIESEPFDVTE